MKTKKIIKSFGAFAMAALISAPLAACGPMAGTQTGPYVPPAETHETLSDIEITMFCNDWEQFNNGAAVRSPVYKELTKVTGCKLKAKSTAYETYYTQLDIQRVNGDLCDMFIIDGPVSPELYRGLIRDGEIIPVSYYVNEDTKDTYPYLYEYLKEYDYMKTNVTYANGEQWFIPVKWSNEKSLYVRRDWVKNLNNKIDDILVADGVVANDSEITDALRTEYRFSEEGPKDLGEFYRLARAFTLYDPDGNGKNDTYGYVTEENRDMDSWLHVAFDNPWRSWTKGEDGKYHNTATGEGSLLATSLLNKLISEGYVGREVGTKNVNNKQEDFATGKAGMMYAHNWYNVILASMMNASSCSIAQARERTLICDPPAGKNGMFGGQGDHFYYRGWCLREGMSVERREACLKLMEYLHSPEGLELVTYGVKGEHWEWKDDIVGGEKVTLCEEDGNGFVQALRWTDPAAFISYLSYTTPEAEALLTNGDILVERANASASTMIIADYPDLYTESMMKFQTGAYDFFDTFVLNSIIDKSLAASWTFDAKTWKDDWKTKLYSVSAAMQTKWDKFVSDYNGVYHGSQMENEYNEAVNSGTLTKYEKQA